MNLLMGLRGNLVTINFFDNLTWYSCKRLNILALNLKNKAQIIAKQDLSLTKNQQL